MNAIRDELPDATAVLDAFLLATSWGALLVTLVLPRILDRVADRTVMTTGAVTLVVGACSAVTLRATDIISWAATGTVWILIGGGMALIVTHRAGAPALGRSRRPTEVFVAQFSLSHLAWLITYPIAGWIGTTSGFTLTWSILAALTAIGSVAVGTMAERSGGRGRGPLGWSLRRRLLRRHPARRRDTERCGNPRGVPMHLRPTRVT